MPVNLGLGRAERAAGRRGGDIPRLLAGAFGVLLAAVLPSARLGAQAGAPITDTASIVNDVSLAYVGLDGLAGQGTARSIVKLLHDAGLTLETPQRAAVRPGGRKVFAHPLRNTGTATDRYTLFVTRSRPDWTVTLWRDADADGQLSAADQLLDPATPSVTLPKGGGTTVFVDVTVPASAPDGAVGTVDLRATSTIRNTLVANVTDELTIAAAKPLFALGIAVDRPLVTNGDTLRFHLTTEQNGTATAYAAVLENPLPAGLRLLSGTIRSSSGLRAATVAAHADARADGRFAGSSLTDDARDTIRVALGDVPVGRADTVTYLAVVTGDFVGRIENRYSVAWLNAAGSAQSATAATSPLVAIAVARAEFGIEKIPLGDSTIWAGADLAYRISWRNRAPVPARDVSVVDTLPAALEFVGSDRRATVDGQVVRFDLGDLAPGDSGSAHVYTRVRPGIADGAEIVNLAGVQGRNGATTATTSRRLTLRNFAPGALQVTKTSNVTDAAVGEAVPFAIAVRNNADGALSNVVVRDILPRGLRLLPRSTAGADSVEQRGDTIVFHLALLPGASERTLRYAAVLVASGGAATLRNVASASALGGSLVSNVSQATIRVRSGYIARNRTVVGKVWVDRNDDGVQQAGEEGVGGVTVWSADGEAVRTDAEGRFSFRDMRPGAVALRLERRALPQRYVFAKGQDEVTFLRADGWTTPSVNIRLVPRPCPSLCDRAKDSTATDSAVIARPAALVADARPVAPARPRVRPARTDAERVEEEGRTFVDGPAVRFFGPVDGTVIGTNRLFLGARGEPGAEVTLYADTTVVKRDRLRPDGVADFIGVEVPEGTTVFRVAMRNSFGKLRWDSLAIHRSGAPARIVAPATVTLRVDAAADTLVVQLHDRWGIPVVSRPAVTLEPEHAQVEATDADLSSVGLQLLADSNGILAFPIKAQRSVGLGALTLRAGATRSRVPLRVLPTVAPMTATGVAQVGLGSQGAYGAGAVTVRGQVGEETAVTLSYDTRRTTGAEEQFGRGYDPLDDARFPTFGDGSERIVDPNAARGFSARVERGLDWLEAGDIRTRAFGGENGILTYDRSLSGVQARAAAGLVAVRGFGALTAQSLQQLQLRGDGSTGPYRLGGRTRPGSERLSIEVRDRNNAAIVVTRRDLVRFTDYEIEYGAGIVMLRQPVPSADPVGNPIFVVALVERAGGDAPSALLGGVRAEVDAARLLRVGSRVDSLGFALLGIRDGTADARTVPGSLVGFDARVRKGGVQVGMELLQGMRADSTPVAAKMDAAVAVIGDERLTFKGAWTRVGAGFGQSLDPRLALAFTEVRVAAATRLDRTTGLELRHELQRFDQWDATRQSTSLVADERLLGRKATQELGLTTDSRGGSTGGSASVLQGRMTLAADARTDIWVDGSRSFDGGVGSVARADQVGVGASYRMFEKTRLESSHRWLSDRTGLGSSAYSTVGLRTEALFGGQMFGGLERASASRASHAAVLGWNQRLALGKGWSAYSMFERRMGLDRAPLLDPARALPFAQPERERWSVGSGAEWMPGADKAHLSLRGEMHGGVQRSGYRIDLAGDAPLGAGAAIITRHDFGRDDERMGFAAGVRRNERSLLGVAVRPVTSNALNVLAKLEWRRTLNPSGALVLGEGLSDTRVIGTADAIWTPLPVMELAGRYAVRRSSAALAGAPAANVEAHFVGARGERDLPRFRGQSFRARIDGRFLLERSTGATPWSVAPALVWRFAPRMELEGGYRVGDLVDRDFQAGGGAGAYLTLGVRFTEQDLKAPAGFWRERVRNGL